MSHRIVVVGSCMMDFVTYSPKLPQPGETIVGKKLLTSFGGKGANQCVAAAKLGGQCALVARVGDDCWGEKYVKNLQDDLKVDTTFVKVTPDVPTGVAQITVADNGENHIVIVPSANDLLGAQDVENAKELIEDAAVLIVQLETPVAVAIKAMELCRGVSILNGAPGLHYHDPKLLKLPSIFCVNETEAEVFSGIKVVTREDALIAAKELLSKGCKSVIITLGSKGAIYLNGNGDEFHAPCPKVRTVDTTGAGDAFIGTLAFLLANFSRYSMEKMLTVACFVATDSVTRAGTQLSFCESEILHRVLHD